MDQVQQRQTSSLTKRIFDFVKKEVMIANTLSTITSSVGFGKTGLVIPMIYRISKMISDFIGGELCVNTILTLGVPKKIASILCTIYKKLFFLSLFVQMTNFSYMNLFADTPTVLSFLVNYGINLKQLSTDLTTDLQNCTEEAIKEIVATSKGVGGFMELGSEVFEDYQSITLNYILQELTNLSIGFSANIGILSHVQSLGDYSKVVYKTVKNLPSEIQKWTFEWSQWFTNSGMSEYIIENKVNLVNEFTNAKQITSYNQTIVKSLDQATEQLGSKKFSQIYESKESVEAIGESMKEKTYDDMGWLERGWALITAKSPMNTSLPLIHENLITATEKSYDQLIDGMKKSNSNVVRRAANTESFSGGYCKKKIKKTLDNFNDLFEKDVKVFNKASKIKTDYLEYFPEILGPQYSSTGQGTIGTRSLQIDPTMNGKPYNPAQDMLVTVNILTLIILILVFVQSIIIPLARLGTKIGKSIYQSVKSRASPRRERGNLQ
jgi:hypothetical protein